MNKLNEEESKLRQKSNLEIGTWSNELAQQEAEQKAKQKAKKNNNNAKNNWEKGPSPEEIDEMEMEMLDLNVALPDNLTFLDESILPQVDPEGGFNFQCPRTDLGKRLLPKLMTTTG